MKKLLLALALVLSACGGGGGGSNGVTAQAAVAVQPVHIADFGNSLAAGLMPGSIEGPATPPAATAQTELRKLIGRTDVFVTSEGRGGSTAGTLLDGTDGSGLPWAQRLSGVQVASVNHGTNENARPVEEYRTDLGMLVSQARAQGVTLVLMTPAPVVPGGSLSGLFSIPEHELKAEVMRQVSTAMNTPLCDVMQAIKIAGRDTLANFPDGVHGTPDAYAFIGREEAKCYASLLH